MNMDNYCSFTKIKLSAQQHVHSHATLIKQKLCQSSSLNKITLTTNCRQNYAKFGTPLLFMHLLIILVMISVIMAHVNKLNAQL